MPNIASILKAEISRVARKEVRAETEALKKASSQHRSALAALRRQIASLQKEIRHAAKSRPAGSAPVVKASSPDDESPRRRFSAARLAAHRAKLGLSAASYGKLIGIGGQTIYNWEQGKSRPNASQVQQLGAIKALNRSAVMEQLGAGETD